MNTQTMIKVPVSWFVGLRNAIDTIDKCEFLRTNNNIEELTYLLGYLDSIDQFIKTSN